jgi:hypothetical protein
MYCDFPGGSFLEILFAAAARSATLVPMRRRGEI